jgi:hypothetical protein
MRQFCFSEVFLVWLFFCDLPLLVRPYSRQYRLYPLHLLIDNVSYGHFYYDPILQNLSEIITQYCSRHSCHDTEQVIKQLKEQYETKLDEDLEVHLGSRYTHNAQGDGSLWLHQSDQKTQSSYENDLKLKSTIADLIANNQPSQSQEFISKQLGYSFPNDQWTTETFQILTRQLFSTEKFFLCLNVCELLYRHLYQSEISFTDLRSIILLSQTMAFSSALIGNLHLSTLFSLKILYLYEQYSRIPSISWPFTSPRVDGIIAIHRLRLLLLVPPLPHEGKLFTSSEYSKRRQSLAHYRKEMEEDLTLFIREVQERQITVTLLVRLSS